MCPNKGGKIKIRNNRFKYMFVTMIENNARRNAREVLLVCC
jgi:hypothetical protein